VARLCPAADRDTPEHNVRSIGFIDRGDDRRCGPPGDTGETGIDHGPTLRSPFYASTGLDLLPLRAWWSPDINAPHCAVGPDQADLVIVHGVQQVMRPVAGVVRIRS